MYEMADIIENEEIDRDIVSPEELNILFNEKYNLLAETAVTLEKTYLKNLSITKSLNVAVSLQDNSIEVYKIDDDSLRKVCKLTGHEKTITELVFSPREDYLLYSIGHDGIKLWDTRTKELGVQQYIDEGNCPSRPYDCLDVSCSGRVLCAGSQLVMDDAFLVFWDQRAPEPLGGYWSSHTEDITQIKFHPDKPEILASGGQDGLLNVFDITESSEDEALTYSLNAEVAVDRVSWLGDDVVACCTLDHGLQLWDSTTGDRLRTCERDRVARGMKRSRPDEVYLVDVFATDEQEAVVLAGSYAGEGEVLRSLSVTDRRLRPATNFERNKQIVRCCAFDKYRDILVTTGESGLVQVWSAETDTEDEVEDSEDTDDEDDWKLSSLKLHEERHRPY